MNEASSKYVDQIAIDKLINEKLIHVHHAPNQNGPEIDTSFSDLRYMPKYPSNLVCITDQGVIDITFSSHIRTPYPNNDEVLIRSYQADNSTGNLIFVHGLYEENIQIYRFFISQLNSMGFNVYLLFLPYHYNRMPPNSHFSGEYFWSGVLERSALAFKQAVYDLLQIYYYVKDVSQKSVWIVGFSMGGGVALVTATLENIDGIFCINPVCNLSNLIWNSKLFSTIKRDLMIKGITLKDIKDKYAHLEPLNQDGIQTGLEKIVIARGLYDQINDPENYRLLVEKWKIRNVIDYKAGHLNILRVPKLANDVERCYVGAI